MYYRIESIKLKAYLDKIKDAAAHLAISDADAKKKLSSFGFKNIFTIPPFHSMDNDYVANNKQQAAPYVLYHGNLNVEENIAAVDYLLKEVFTDNTIKYVIAGSGKGHFLQSGLGGNISIIENPSYEEITALITNASVITLPTFQSTGIKLKLIDSLYKGQHVIVNEAMVDGFPLPELILLAKNTEDMKSLINENLKKFLLQKKELVEFKC